jgi:rhodanese-related sulfurtransferase
VKQLPVSQLSAWLSDPERGRPLLIDVREPWEYEICRTEGSASMPLGRLPERLDGIDAQRPVVCICHHGARSLHAAMLLEQHGCREVYNLSGGVDAWARQVDPGMPIY